MQKSLVCAGWFVGVCLVSSLAVTAYAQDAQNPQPRGEVYIDAHHGGTPLSYQIEAEAKYVRAYGQFLESATNARKINAEAVSLEIENSVKYVEAYFKRKDINKEWREKNEWKSYFESLDLQQKAMEKRIDEYFQNTLKGDVTNELNYLLQKLYFVQYMRPGDLPLDTTTFTKDDLEQIYLTDGKLVFEADDAEVLKTPWPYALHGPEFAEERKEFDDSRDAVVQEIQGNGHADKASGQRMLKAVIQLRVTLETVYLPEKRKDFNVYQEYKPAELFLKSMTGQVTRVLGTNDRAVFDGSLSFKGNTLLDLMQHMYKSGLMFAKPPSGDDRVYKPIFTDMRHLYLTLGPEKREGGNLPAQR